ncbi:hypothetical protein J5N97_010057 [Dioscorea zingiberensis]|uniref:Histone-lysine N-methyltransferase SUVR5 n=1 Tax=Dioscorea zingiberensis TaxID=325984 RepID=A0A9D5CZG4_9LILI|nr:hypothetical protein J5N97_010057 [Dioscorea zingiberensis]
MSVLSCSEVHYIGEQNPSVKPMDDVVEEHMLLQVEHPQQRVVDKLAFTIHDRKQIVSEDYYARRACDVTQPNDSLGNVGSLTRLECAQGSSVNVNVNGFLASETPLPKVECYKQWQGDERLNNSTRGNANFLKNNSFFQEGCDLSNGNSEDEVISLKSKINKEKSEQFKGEESAPVSDSQHNLEDSCIRQVLGSDVVSRFCGACNFIVHLAGANVNEINESKDGSQASNNTNLLRNGTSGSCSEEKNGPATVCEPSELVSVIDYEQGNLSAQSQDCKSFTPSKDFHLSIEKLGNKVQDNNQVGEFGLSGTESPKEEHAVALWVKWRGKWRTGILCPRVDCPLPTLRAKPTHERKKYFAIFFPRTRTYSWADMLLVRSIDELPEPLVYGTHRRWRKLVKDLTVPRRYIMQKLGVAMLNISDRLHSEAVVEHARNATAWKEFAVEASHSRDYSDLGRMLLKLQTMILPSYISQLWLDASFNSWVQRCQSVNSAETVEILTEELFNSVLWNEVEVLWNAPVQPDLGPEWKTWKQEVMKFFSTAYPRAGKGDIERKNDDSSLTVGIQISRKRPKLEVQQTNTSVSGTDAADQGFLSDPAKLDANSGHLNCQSIVKSVARNEGQVNAIPRLGAVADSNTMSDTRNEIGVEDESVKFVRSSQVSANATSNKTTTVSSHQGADTMKYRQCSAFIEAKGRRCGRWANDGDVFCCVHLNTRSVGRPYQDEHKAPVEAPMCEGTTTHGNKCKHRARYGSAFCKKHRCQESNDPMVCNDLPHSCSNELKRNRTALEHLPSPVTISEKEFSWVGDAQTSLQENLIPVLVEETLDERNCLMKKSELNSALPSNSSVANLDFPLCIGHYHHSNGEQCLEVAKKHTLYCEKHLPKFLKRARNGKSRLVSKDVFLDLLRNCSSRKQKLYLHQACELLYGFMKSNLSHQKPVPKDDSMGWVLSEASIDPHVGEYLLKLVSSEREKIARIWGFGADNVKQVPSEAIVHDLVVHDGDKSEMTVRCKICTEKFSDNQSLGLHWTEIHKKELRWLFRGFACAICMNSFTNRKVLEAHLKEKHGLQFFGHSVLFRCMSCDSHFASPDQLWQHVLSYHSLEFCQQDLTQQQAGTLTQAEHPDIELGNKLCQNISASEKDGGSQRFVCRFCGLKFDLLPDLGRHHQVAHMSHFTSKRGSNHLRRGRHSYPRLKRSFDATFRIKDCNNLGTQKHFESSNLVIAPRARLQTQSSETVSLGRLLDSHCSDVALTLFSEIQKTKPRPSNLEILSAARTACCRTSLRTALEMKYGLLPENLCLKAAKLCSELNVPVDWHLEGFICSQGCMPLAQPHSLPPLKPIADPFRPTGTTELVNIAEWEMDECHYILDSKHFTLKPIQKIKVLCEDLSFGKEPVPVRCVIDGDLKKFHNEELGLDMPWQDFAYVTKRVVDPSLGLYTENSLLGCTCLDLKCYPENCDHVYLFDNDYENAMDIHGESMHGRFPYDEKSRIILEEGYLVYECNSMCKCDSSCCNRVLQKGVRVKLEVFRTEKKGWAVRAGEAIPHGTFVCEYIGEVLSDVEANKREERYDIKGCSYLYDIDAHIDGTSGLSGMVPYVIDATNYGNVSRFINHSCSPNLVNYLVLVESMDCQLAHIGLYASRDISVGEELAYDYRYKLLPGDGCPCLCGASNCRGRLY